MDDAEYDCGYDASKADQGGPQHEPKKDIEEQDTAKCHGQPSFCTIFMTSATFLVISS